MGINQSFLYEKISNKLKQSDHISHKLFKQNIMDHKLILLQNSTLFNISPQLQSIYIHRDNLFLKEKLNLKYNLLWIIKFINDIPDHKSLLEYKKIKIPNNDTINIIIDKYKILKSKLSSDFNDI